MNRNQSNDNHYLLLTPGPLTTSKSVKEVMLKDWCTWDDDYNVHVVQEIRNKLVELATHKTDDYTSVLMQGSGTFAVESAIGSIVPAYAKILILANGAYGRRIIEIARVLKIKHLIYEIPESETFEIKELQRILNDSADITHVAMVHCETTTGILNPLDEIATCASSFNKILIVDAMSSFGGIPMDIGNLNIDVLISSSNKCIQGVPGFGFVIIKKTVINNCEGISRSHALDLFAQWKTMESGNGKWRFTSPTHVVRAFLQAIKELEEEGGVNNRHARYILNQALLVIGMRNLGFETLLPDQLQSPIITSFLFPPIKGFNFNDFYNSLKRFGFIIYPGKISKVNTFRIGNIGEVYPEHIIDLLKAIEGCMLIKSVNK